MTNEQIRIAMAEVDGWFIAPKHWKHNGHLYPNIDTWIPPHYVNWQYDTMPAGTMLGDLPPDYPKDLNAVHEVEKKFQDNGAIDSERNQYDKWLWGVTAGRTISATALQRCEAILRTLGKWVE